MSKAQKIISEEVKNSNIKLDDENLIFVGGIARSGTTLVQNVIDSHSKILGLPEFKNTERIIYLHRQMKDEIKKGFIDLICNEQELDLYYKNFIKSFFAPLKEEYNVEFISEKHPPNLKVFDDLIHLFPKSKFVLVTRDPRAILNSMKHVRHRARKKRLIALTGSWNDITNRIKNEFELTCKLYEKYPKKIFFIRYEDIVTDIEGVTKDFCRYMSIEWEPEMMRPGDHEHLNEKGMISDYNAAFYDKVSFNRNADTSSLYKWKDELTKQEKNDIYDLLKSSGIENKFGYKLSKEPMSIFDHISGITISASQKLVRIFYIIQRYAQKFNRI